MPKPKTIPSDVFPNLIDALVRAAKEIGVKHEALSDAIIRGLYRHYHPFAANNRPKSRRRRGRQR